MLKKRRELIRLNLSINWMFSGPREPEAHTKDAWFHSLNYLRPKAVRAAFQYLQYLQWSMKNAGQTTFAFSNTSELADYFNRHSDPSHEPCLSVRLIFGELFPTSTHWTQCGARPRLIAFFRTPQPQNSKRFV
jgi:hypothetical protein